MTPTTGNICHLKAALLTACLHNPLKCFAYTLYLSPLLPLVSVFKKYYFSFSQLFFSRLLRPFMTSGSKASTDLNSLLIKAILKKKSIKATFSMCPSPANSQTISCVNIEACGSLNHSQYSTQNILRRWWDFCVCLFFFSDVFFISAILHPLLLNDVGVQWKQAFIIKLDSNLSWSYCLHIYSIH